MPLLIVESFITKVLTQITSGSNNSLLYDVPNLSLPAVRIDVHTTFRDPDGASERACILTTTASREAAREVDWEGWTAAEIVDAFGGRYRLGERGAALPIDPEEGAEAPAAGGSGAQAGR